ncbi:alpha/beta hydrolase [Saccharomonospora sp. NPDC046836]|uniref:alpha/beta hydrolase n=1 Tax=Saccharomonospora sp. NPDC046836 TaxID=3156921 RepID=UPI0033F897C0
MRLLFFHGAGGFDDDRAIADDLGRALGSPINVPRLPDEDMSLEAWATPIRRSLGELRADDAVVAHSFGASVLLHVLAEGVPAPSKVVLLAMPNWGPNGWDVEDYAFGGTEPLLPFSLHHCRDDEVVPFVHLALNAAELPSARVREHASGGHQFDGLADTISADLVG